MMSITTAIANQIDKIIPNATIYIENQEQKFAEPSFYIYEIMSDSKDELMRQEMRKHLYCVMWFPDSSLDEPGVKEQCENMRTTLLDELSFLDDLSIKLMDREAKIEQEALNFTFKLRYKVRKKDLTPKLDFLDQRGGLKDG